LCKENSHNDFIVLGKLWGKKRERGRKIDYCEIKKSGIRMVKPKKSVIFAVRKSMNAI